MHLFINKILVIDDLPSIHEDFRKILTINKKQTSDYDKIKTDIFGVEIETPEEGLEKLHYVIDSAYSGKEGLELVKKSALEHAPYTLAFVDIHMPDSDGIKTVQSLWHIDPEIQVVFCTAFSDYTWEDMASRLGNSDNFLILKKPFDPIEIRQLVLSLVKKWDLMKQGKQYLSHLESIVQERTLELEHAYSLTNAVLDTIQEAIFVIDDNGKVIKYNKAFLELWHISKDLLEIGNFNLIVQQLCAQVKDPEGLGTLLRSLARQPKSGQVGTIEMENDARLMFFVHPFVVKEEIKGCIFSFLKYESIACQP